MNIVDYEYIYDHKDIDIAFSNVLLLTTEDVNIDISSRSDLKLIPEGTRSAIKCSYMMYGRHAPTTIFVRKITKPITTTKLDVFISESYHSVLLDLYDEDSIKTTSAWCETNRKNYITCSQDSACWDSGDTTDILSFLNQEHRRHTMVLAQENSIAAHMDAAVAGELLGLAIGQGIAFGHLSKKLTPTTLPMGAISTILTKRGNVYTRNLGYDMTSYGRMSSGLYWDEMRNVDWVDKRIKTSLERLSASLGGFIYAPSTVAQVGAIASQIVSEAVVRGVFTNDPKPKVDVSNYDITGGVLSGIKYTATVSSVIQDVQIESVDGGGGMN